MPNQRDRQERLHTGKPLEEQFPMKKPWQTISALVMLVGCGCAGYRERQPQKTASLPGKGPVEESQTTTYPGKSVGSATSRLESEYADFGRERGKYDAVHGAHDYRKEFRKDP